MGDEDDEDEIGVFKKKVRGLDFCVLGRENEGRKKELEIRRRKKLEE